MQLNQREGDKNHPGASGGNLISRGGGGRNDVQSIAIFKNTPAARRSCGRGGEKSERGEERGTERKRCLQNQTDDIGGGGGLVSNSPPSFVRPDYRNEFETFKTRYLSSLLPFLAHFFRPNFATLGFSFRLEQLRKDGEKMEARKSRRIPVHLRIFHRGERLLERPFVYRFLVKR